MNPSELYTRQIDAYTRLVAFTQPFRDQWNSHVDEMRAENTAAYRRHYLAIVLGRSAPVVNPLLARLLEPINAFIDLARIMERIATEYPDAIDDNQTELLSILSDLLAGEDMSDFRYEVPNS